MKIISCNCGHKVPEYKWVELEMFNGQEVFAKVYDSVEERKVYIGEVKLIACPKCNTVKLQ